MKGNTVSIAMTILTIVSMILLAPISAETTTYPPDIQFQTQQIVIAPNYNYTINFFVYNHNNIEKSIDYTLENIPSGIEISVEFLPSTTIPPSSYIQGIMHIRATDNYDPSEQFNPKLTVYWIDERAVYEYTTLTVYVSPYYEVKFEPESNPYILAPYTYDSTTNQFTLMTSIDFSDSPDGIHSSPLKITSYSNTPTMNVISAEIVEDNLHVISHNSLYAKKYLYLGAQSLTLTNSRSVPFGFTLATTTYPDNYKVSIKFTATTYDYRDCTILPSPDPSSEPTISFTSDPKTSTSIILDIVLKSPPTSPPSSDIDFELRYISAETINGIVTDNVITAEPNEIVKLTYAVFNTGQTPLKITITWAIYRSAEDFNVLGRTEDGYVDFSRSIDLTATPLSSSFNPEDFLEEATWTSSGLYIDGQTSPSPQITIIINPNEMRQFYLQLVPPSNDLPDNQYVVKITGVTFTPESGLIKKTIFTGLQNSDNFKPSQQQQLAEISNEMAFNNKLPFLLALILIASVIVGCLAYYYEYNKKNPIKGMKKKL